MGTSVALFRRARAIRRQLQYAVFTGQLAGPVRQLTFALAGLHPLPLPGGIVGVLDGQRCQCVRLSRLGGAVQADQFLHHQLHRPAIGNDVVLGQYQYMFIVRQTQQPDPQQWAVLEVEQLPGFVLHKGLDRGVVRRAVQRLDHQRQRCLVGDDLAGLFVVHHEGGAQCFVTRDQLIERVLQRRDIQRALEAQGGRQVVRGAVRVQLPEEPLALLCVGQGQRLSAFDGHQWQLMLPRATVQAGDEIPEHAAFEQAAQGHIQPQGLTHPGDDLGRQQRMAAQCEEVIREAHLLKVEHALPDSGDLDFQGRSRRHIVVLLLAGIRFGQRFTVQLAVRAQGQYIKEHQEARDHIVRQHGCQRGFDRLAQLCVRHGRGLGHHITHQLQTAGGRLGEDDGVSHHVVLQQSGFDFAQLDTEPANLHLMVDPADVLDHPVGGVARKVAGAVQAAATLAERVGHEALGRQVRAIEITPRQQLAADHQFAHHANRRRGTAVVQQVNAASGQDLADGHGQGRGACAGYIVGAIKGRDRHRGFSRAVGVE